MDLQTSIGALPKVGYHFKSALNKLGIFTVEDLLHHYPFRYDDFSQTTTAIETKIGETVTLTGEIWSIQNIFTKSRKVLTRAVFNDGTSGIELTWFNSPWLTKSISTGDRLQISGKISKFKNKLSIVAPVWEKVGAVEQIKPSLNTGRLVPIYPETFGLTSKWLRQKIADTLPLVKDQIEDYLPDEIRQDLPSLRESLSKIHFPENYDDVNLARKRLSFDELFFVQLATQKMRLSWQEKPTVQEVKVDSKKVDQFIKSLPFELTSAQKKVVGEIIEDLKQGQPMNRLVQGEVGSGKTVVAAVIIYLMHLNNLQSLLMAPTEILAFQHHKTISNLLESYGIKVGIYTGSRKFTKKQVVSSKYQGQENPYYILPATNPDVIVGTHALLSEKLDTENVGLVIIDEQQRFGVEQRSILRSKATVPHFLTMTATPIPRTIALTIYGDLDLSVINELPRGRKDIRTHVVPSIKRDDAYKFIAKKVEEGDQVYIITPLIELSETIQSAKSAKVEFERLKSKVFTKYRLGLLHGRLKPKEKDEVLESFRKGEIDILVSTSVVEVGVDVPNATIMVIESSERFGLAQLHQLRGRVGRGEKESFCLLFTEDQSAPIVRRLKNMETISDGLMLAELDMKIRGAGQIYGVRQSGRLELKIADFSDMELIEKTREAARKILKDNPPLDKYPLLRVKLANIMAKASPD